MFFPLIWTYLKTPVWFINSLKSILLVVTIVVDACWLEPIPLLINGYIYTVSIVFLQSVLEPDPAPLIYQWQNGALVPASPHRGGIQASKRVYIAPWWPLWKRSRCVGTKPTCFFLPCRYQEVIWSYPFILLAYGTWKQQKNILFRWWRLNVRVHRCNNEIEKIILIPDATFDVQMDVAINHQWGKSWMKRSHNS